MSLGPRSSGSVGDMLIRQSFNSENLIVFMVRFVYDVTIFIIVNVTFMNLISGIIIDTFAELRDEKNSTEENKRNLWFVCSIHRSILDKDGEGFEEHTMKSHYLWNYLFFIYHLKMKPTTEYNGIESFVTAKLASDDISWLPIQSSIAINRKQGAQRDVAKEISGLDSTIEELLKK